LYFK
jgi:HAD superfamily 5'-nucleotidase-like hydrolase